MQESVLGDAQTDKEGGMKMGTIYRTACGCIASREEPSTGEYPTLDAYLTAQRRWEGEWRHQASEHEEACPKSAYCRTPRPA
jgi:hypothetical protein